MVALERAAWLQGFADLLPAGFELPTVEGWTERLGEVVRSTETDTLVVEDREGLAGFVVYGPSRDKAADVGEIRTLFVEPGRWRCGVGAALVAGALDALGSAGYEQVTLWSFRDNHRASAFYAAMGFERDGATVARAGHGDSVEVQVRYARSVAPDG